MGNCPFQQTLEAALNMPATAAKFARLRRMNGILSTALHGKEDAAL